MKDYLSIIVFVALLPFVTPASAVDVTITVTTAEANRVAAWIGRGEMNLGRDATMAEVKTWLIQQITNGTKSYEREEARKALAPPAALDPK